MVIPPALEAYFYLPAIALILLFLAGSGVKLAVISRAGGELSMHGLLWLSLVSLFSADCLLARRVFPRSRLRGMVLVLMIWGFLLIIAGGVVSYAVVLLGIQLRSGYHLLSLALDIAGVLLLVGVLYALARRYLLAGRELYSTPEDAVFLLLLLVIILSGFAVEGARLAIFSAHDPYSPVGSLLAAQLHALPLKAKGEMFVYAKLVHFLSSFALLAYLPFSKAMHMLAAQLTTRFARERERLYY